MIEKQQQLTEYYDELESQMAKVRRENQTLKQEFIELKKGK